jgi:hypothetical protein
LAEYTTDGAIGLGDTVVVDPSVVVDVDASVVEASSVGGTAVDVGANGVAGGAAVVVDASVGAGSAGGSGWVAAAGCDNNVIPTTAPTTASNRIVRWQALPAAAVRRVRRSNAIQDMKSPNLAERGQRSSATVGHSSGGGSN